MPEVGQKVGPFELVERLGAARDTTLFRGVRQSLTREPETVAIRVANNVENAEATEVVRREYEVLRALSDSRIPSVIGFYPGQAALALGWVGDLSLADVIAAARSGWTELDPATALDIALEVANALRAAHSVVRAGHPVLHGHLGPQRVRLSVTGDVFVVGFGLDGQGRHPAYTPPELAARQTLDTRADQWALGSVLSEMLLRRRLYDGEFDAAEAAMEGRTDVYVAEVERQWPVIGRLLRKLLARAPQDRFASDGEVVSALLTAGREVGGVANRSAVVASVLRQRELGGRRSEPMPAMSVAFMPAATDDDSDSVSETDAGGGDDDDTPDPFPDTPTSPDGLSILAGALFARHADSPGMAEAEEEETDPNVSRSEVTGEADVFTDPGPSPARSPAPPPTQPARLASGLQAGELAAVGLIVVLVFVGIYFLVAR